jgi:EthD domain
MIKCVALIRRRLDISHESFRDYYENHHAPLAQQYMPGATRYQRRYLQQARLQHQEAEILTGNAAYDVITEIWFPHEIAMNRCLARLAEPTVARIIIDDEERFIDRDSIRFYVIASESDPNL